MQIIKLLLGIVQLAYYIFKIKVERDEAKKKELIANVNDAKTAVANKDVSSLNASLGRLRYK